MHETQPVPHPSLIPPVLALIARPLITVALFLAPKLVYASPKEDLRATASAGAGPLGLLFAGLIVALAGFAVGAAPH